MNRTIKFRAWDNVNLEMVNDTEEIFDQGPNIYIMQYIGIKDKNQKDIYEGDIYEFRSTLRGDWGHGPQIRHTHFILKVVFHSGSFCGEVIYCDHERLDNLYYEDEVLLDYRNENIGKQLALNSTYDDPYTIKESIIGNIYENPEILDKYGIDIGIQ